MDNIGDRQNYVVFEFDQMVTVDRVYLEYVGADSDATVWIGTATDPYNNHLTPTDSLLASFGSEDNNGSDTSARWANINASNEAGNVLIVAASTSDTSPEDAFKIKQIDVKCPGTPATVTIIKEVQATGGATSSPQSFPFTATNFGTANFALVDQNASGPDRISNNAIYSFGAGNAITVTEGQLSGWTLLDIVCTESGTQNSSVDLGLRKATIIAEAGENITCTFRNGQISPSAATATVTGRVTTSEGRGINGATVTVMNASTGALLTARTNALGYYSIEGLEVTEFYSLTVTHKSYVFAPDTQFFTLNEDTNGVDFMAIQ